MNSAGIHLWRFISTAADLNEINSGIHEALQLLDEVFIAAASLACVDRAQPHADAKKREGCFSNATDNAHNNLYTVERAATEHVRTMISLGR